MSWILLLSVSAIASDEGTSGSGKEPVETVYGQPIDSGFVIFKGQYVPPPYVVGRRGDDVLVNEHQIPVEGMLVRSQSRRPRGRRSGREWTQSDQDQQALMLVRVERQLDEEGLLIVLEDGPSGFIRSADPISILNILLSDSSGNSRLITYRCLVFSITLPRRSVC
jgi:hypothetical protein